MSRERHDKQRDKIAEEAAAYLRSRALLAPAPIAMAVRHGLGGRAEHPQSSLPVLQMLGAVGIWR